MKYVKAFETHNQYETYINGDGKILPNVSYCENLREIHYNPYSDPRLIAKFNVEDDSDTTMIFAGMDYGDISVLDNFTKIEVDGVEISLTDLDENNGYYQLSEGEHTIRYTLTDPTEMVDGFFGTCQSLTSVTIPNSVTSIGDAAFESCSNLTSVTIPNSVTSISESAFNGCSGLTNVVIPNSVTSIGVAAFTGCTALTNVTIPNSVTTIGTYAFSGCSGLTNVVIPNSVTTIGQGAFTGCSSLTSVTIPNSVTSIGSNVFTDCTRLTSIKVNSGNTVYDSKNNCNAIIETATNTLIAGCRNTVIPNSVTSIGNYAFNGCSGLTNVVIPNSVTSIGTYAFSYCSGLTSVTIGNSVTTIGNSAFYGCSGLTSITSLATTAPTIQSSTFQSVKTGGTLTVPSGSTGYNTWMGTGNYYLGKYNWTKVEQ